MISPVTSSAPRPPLVTRRQSLGVVATVTLTAGVTGGLLLLPDRRERTRSLRALFPDAGSAFRIGEAYRRENPNEAHAEQLETALFGSRSEADRWLPRPTDELAEWVRARHREDLEANHTVRVNRWILTATEARICALIAAT